ncbi:MAG: transcription antitermination factor NusB [Bacteroidota bacterium]
MKSQRRIVRGRVMQALYAFEISGGSQEAAIENVLAGLSEEDNDIEFAKKLFFKVLDTRAELDKLIHDKLPQWELHRVAVIDRMLLRIGVCEFLYFDDIPPKVTINEAIEIAKLFSTDASGKFVNGVLDAVHQDLKNSGKLVKRGLGLITNSVPRKKKNNAIENPQKE